MQNLDEIDVFADNEGFEKRPCRCGAAATCDTCGGSGVVYVVHDVEYSQKAVELMSKSRLALIGQWAHWASVALYRARGSNDFAQQQSELNQVARLLLAIHNKTVSSSI